MRRRKLSRKTHPLIRLMLWLTFAALLGGIYILFKLYSLLFLPSAGTGERGTSYFYIYSGSDYETVVSDLVTQGIVKNRKAFEWLAKKKNYPAHIRSGRYKITPGMSGNELVNMLRSGNQEPLMVTFNNVRTLEQLSGVLARQLEPESLDFLEVLTDSSIMKKYGFERNTFPAMFIPNSYEFYWNTRAAKFVDRMNAEYIVFWASGRAERAKEIGMTPLEVSTLASIVDQESQHDEENPRIAGVFINRIRAGIPLQSDPTIIYAWKDYNIRRVLNKHKEINSPYNTYKIKGLPPGPISLPSVSAIEGVLNYEHNDYLYFCAKDDFSGYHHFSRSLSRHLEFARKYQRALNQRKIFN